LYAVIPTYIKNKYNILIILKKRILYIFLGVLIANVSFAVPVITFTANGATTFCSGNSSTKLRVSTTENIWVQLQYADIGSSSWTNVGFPTEILAGTPYDLTAYYVSSKQYQITYDFDFTMPAPTLFLSTITLTVNPLPTITTTGTLSALCYSTSLQNATLNYTATTYTPTSYTVDWNAAANSAGLSDQTSTAASFLASGGNLATINIASSILSGTYNGSLIISNSNGCTSNKSINILIKPLPVVSFDAAAGLNECQNSEITYTTQSGKTNYQWSSSGILNTDYIITNGGLGTTNNTVSLKWLTTGSKTMQINYTDINACTAVATTNTTTTVKALPVINNLMDTTKVCGTKTILDAGAGYSSYLWNTGANTRYITTDITQNYFVTVTNSSSCSSVDSTFLSIVDAKLFNSDTTILAGNTVNLNAHGILNNANRAMLYDFSNANALNDFVTLTTNSGTVTITTNGQTGNGVEVIRANNPTSDAEMKTTREDFGYGTYEVDAYSASGIADQSFGIMEQSGSWLNRVLYIGTRPASTDNPGWDVVFKGISIASSNTSPVSNSTWYKIKVYITPTTLKVWLNSIVIFDGALPSAITNPKGAIRVGAYDVSRYDNIKYTPLQELSYLWSTSSTNQNITVTPTVTSTYQLKVTDQTTTCNTSVDIRVLKINITNADASICNNTTQTLYIDSSFSKYASWQTKKPGIEFYNIKKDLNGNLYALPSLNNQKIYKSIDRGETWNQMAGFPSLGSNNFMALGVDQNNVIYASTNHNGIYKSVDEGITWTQLQDFGGGCGPMDILFGNNYSILTVKGFNRGIWSSNGELINWQQKVAGFDPNTVTQDINGNLYAGGNSAGGKELYKSSNLGATWSKISSLYGVQIIRADSNGKVFLTEGGNNPLFVSSNQGTSFSQINTLSLPNSGISYPEDILFIKNIMFITKGQVYYSKNDGAIFTQLAKLTFPTAGTFNYGPGGAPNNNYGDSTNRMEMIGNRLFVASLDGIKFIDIDNLSTTVTWSTGEVGNKIEVNPISTSPGNTVTYSATVSYGAVSGSDQVTFTLPTKPTITASGATTFCQGGTVTLTANSSPAGVYSYTWQTGAITQGINVASSGSYTVTAVNSIGCSETSTPTIIIVNALPSAPVAVPTTVCYDGAVHTASATPGEGESVVWYTASTGGTTTTQPSATAAGTNTVYALAKNSTTSCESATRTSVALIINALPTVSATVTPSIGVVCIGSNATLTGVGASTYTYTGGVTNATPFVPRTTTTYTVTGTDANGCVSTNTKTITVNPLPAAPNVSDKEYCFNETAIPLTATNLANHNLGWYGTDASGGTSAVTAPTPLTNIVGSSIYYVSQTNTANSCESPRAAININVKALPPTPTITSNSPVCEGAALTLNTTNIAGAIYYWEGVNGFTSSSVNPTINNVSSAIAGNYSLKIKFNGCVSPLSTPLVVAVNPIPAAPTVSSNSPIEEDKTLNLTASNVTGATYAWSGPNGFASVQQNPSITASLLNAGIYYATVALNGCTSVSSLPINVLVTPKILVSPVFQIPNAFTPNSDGHNDTFKIIENGYVTSIIGFKIFTKSGKLIFNDKDGAWDGRYAGVMLDADVYIWIADFINKNNVTEHLSGTVLLLK